MDLKSTLETINLAVEKITDPSIKVIVMQLLNVIEELASKNKALHEEVQRLRDENNRLQGEQGKPSICKQTQSKNDISSEKERKKKRQQKKREKKKGRLTIHRHENCTIDATQLPADAVFKGYQTSVVQDIVIRSHNVEFKKAIYYCPSLKKSITAPSPAGYEGEFGPTIKALVLDMHHNGGSTQSAIHRFLQTHGVLISPASISRLLTDNHEPFHQEKDAIVAEGLASSNYQQMDDTSARVKGKNHYTHVLCNAFYSAYFTRAHKNRLTLIELLTQGEMRFVFNEKAAALMKVMHLSEKQLLRLYAQAPQEVMSREEIDLFLNTVFPDPTAYQTSRQIVLDACAIIAYQQLPHAINLLLTDDAPQFKHIASHQALCWVHDGRHYKKLEPLLAFHQQQHKDFLTRYWQYYHQLLAYQLAPTSQRALELATEFDTLFSTLTGYALLDERIHKTQAKKDNLLLVLTYPELPLHNNASELGARVQARYRDISFHTLNAKGTKSNDTFMTIVATAKKCAVNTFQYFYDRITQHYHLPSLASLISSNAQAELLLLSG